MCGVLTRVLLLSMLLLGTAQAAYYGFDFTSGAAIPDGNLNGYQDSRTVSGVSGLITDVEVTLNISGGYNGDLYAYLVHSSGFAVLLNRTGRTSTDSFGYDHTGFIVTLSSAATADIHSYGNFSPTFNGAGQLLGTWQPDARAVDPRNVTDASARTASLSSFNGLDANGTWTLFVADVSYGEQSTLNSWGLEIQAVPEPTTVALSIFAGLLVVLRVLARAFAWIRRARPRAPE